MKRYKEMKNSPIDVMRTFKATRQPAILFFFLDLQGVFKVNRLVMGFYVSIRMVGLEFIVHSSPMLMLIVNMRQWIVIDVWFRRTFHE